MGKNYFILMKKQKNNFLILRMCSEWSEWILRRPPIGRIFLVNYRVVMTWPILLGAYVTNGH